MAVLKGVHGWKPEYNGALLEPLPYEPYIETYTGTKFYFLKPTPAMIHIEDIAHALANQCRFTGHSNRFYSVAEHSVRVAGLCENKLAGLLHDASEAYLTDVASPVKQYLLNYKTLEDAIMKAIATKFGFPFPFEHEVHVADKVLLAVEADKFIASHGKEWPVRDQFRSDIHPQGWTPERAEKEFLAYFRGIV